jgi:hypothetical protein
MIVVITSFAPVVARRTPAIPPQSAPPASAARIARMTCRTCGMPSNEEPTQTAPTVPAMY